MKTNYQWTIIFTNFHGYLGKIMVYNKYLEKSDLCKNIIVE